nr:hypothetical protein TetV2_00489 [Oceanusvirus sp.]
MRYERGGLKKAPPVTDPHFTNAATMVTNKTRSITWRGLLRLMAVGTDVSVPNDCPKLECVVRLNSLCGDALCPLDMRFSVYRNHFHAFAVILSMYTGKSVLETDTYFMFENNSNQGYRHTTLFWDTVGDMPWPPEESIRRPLAQKKDFSNNAPAKPQTSKRKRDPENTPPLPTVDSVENLWDWKIVEKVMFGGVKN